MKVLQRSLLVLFALLLGSSIAPSLSQATNLSNQSEKVENGGRLLISQMNYLSDADYVKTIWHKILGRDVDEYGVGMHVQILTSKQQTRQQMRENIARGEESRLRITNSFQNYLNRNPNSQEMNKYVYRLGRGYMTTFDVDQDVLNYANNGGT